MVAKRFQWCARQSRLVIFVTRSADKSVLTPNLYIWQHEPGSFGWKRSSKRKLDSGDFLTLV